MNQSLFSRKLCLSAVAAGLLALAGCSDQATNQAANQAPKQPGKASVAPKKAVAAAPQAKVVAASAKVTAGSPQPITIPKGTSITATMGETIASAKVHKGDTFAATLSSNVTLDGKTVLPKGAHVTGKVVTVKKDELRVALASIRVHGKSYDLATNSLRPSDRAKTAASKNVDKQKKDNSTLSAQSKLTFKLAKPVTVPAKG